MTRVLLIEKRCTFDVSRPLTRAGMAVDRIDDSFELELAELAYDVIVFDLVLGGTQLIRQLRAKAHQMPIVALIGVDNFKIRVQALDAGADAVLEMPFFVAELVAVIRALTRRRFGLTSNVVRIGRMMIDLDRQAVEIDDKPTHALSTLQFQLLALLAQHKGRLLSKVQIIAHLYPDDREPAVGLKIIDVMLAQIRRRLGPVSREYLRTVHGTGHCIDDSPPRIRLAQRLAHAA